MPEFISVQWYVRAGSLQTSLRKKLKFKPGTPPLDDKREVLLDGRPFHSEVKVNTVWGKCQVSVRSSASR